MSNSFYQGSMNREKPCLLQHKQPLLILELALGWALLGVILFLGAYWGLHSSPMAGHPADFAIYRTAAAILKSGEGDKLYDLETQQKVFRRVVGRADLEFIVWNHHPVEAILYLPAALGSYEFGLQLARWINVLLMCGLVAWTAARLGQKTDRLLFLGLILALGLSFFASAITMGQDSIWVLVLIVVGLIAASDGRFYYAGTLLGLASIKFTVVLPLLAIMVLGITHYRKVVAIALAVSVTIALLPVFLIGPSVLYSYVKLCLNILTLDGQLGLYSPLLWNFRGIVLKWIGTPGLVMAMTLCSGLLYALVMKWVPRPKALGLALFGATLFSPHVYRHDGVMYVGSAIVLLLISKTNDPAG